MRKPRSSPAQRYSEPPSLQGERGVSLRRSFGTGIEFAVLVAPAVKAWSGLTREQVGAAHGCRRMLGHDAVELVGFARVLACNAVKERWQRLVGRMSDGGDEDRLVQRAHAIASPHTWLAAGGELAPHHLTLGREAPGARHLLRLPGGDGPSAGPQEEQAVAAGEQADWQSLDGIKAHDAVVRVSPLRGAGGTVIFKVP